MTNYMSSFLDISLANRRNLQTVGKVLSGHLKNIHNVTNKVDCGPRRKPQVIHVDSVRLKKGQILEHEIGTSDRQNNEHETDT